jgi:hypothetical protein
MTPPSLDWLRQEGIAEDKVKKMEERGEQLVHEMRQLIVDLCSELTPEQIKKLQRLLYLHPLFSGAPITVPGWAQVQILLEVDDKKL